MALTLPNIPMAYSPTFSEEPRRRVVSFGDGYSLRSLDGLNAVTTKVSVQWRAIKVIEMQILRNFFLVHQGVQYFLWTPTSYSLAAKWVCPQYSWSPVKDSPSDGGTPRYWDFDANFEQVHDLA